MSVAESQQFELAGQYYKYEYAGLMDQYKKLLELHNNQRRLITQLKQKIEELEEIIKTNNNKE